MAEVKHTEYMCSWCGKKVVRTSRTGRPVPGNCPRRKYANGTMKPHVWVVNRKY